MPTEIEVITGTESIDVLTSADLMPGVALSAPAGPFTSGDNTILSIDLSSLAVGSYLEVTAYGRAHVNSEDDVFVGVNLGSGPSSVSTPFFVKMGISVTASGGVANIGGFSLNNETEGEGYQVSAGSSSGIFDLIVSVTNESGLATVTVNGACIKQIV